MRKLDPRPIYYVYILFDWLGVPRYVGKGKGGTKRENIHEQSSDASNWLKNEFIEQTWIMLEEIPKIIIKDEISEKEAFKLEAFLIKIIGRLDIKTGPLTNMTNGGEGASGYRHTIKTLKKISATHLGRKRTLETREKLRRSALKQSNRRAETMRVTMAGRQWSLERRLKRSKMTIEQWKDEKIREQTRQSLIKLNKLPGEKEKRRLAFLGGHHTDDAKQRIGEASSKRPRTEETKRKTSNTLMGHLVSEKTREKIRRTLLNKKLTSRKILVKLIYLRIYNLSIDQVK